MVLLMWTVIIVATCGVFILLYNIFEHFMWDNFFTITLISIISFIVSLVVGGLFWGIKETYKVVDVKNYSYIQQIVIEDDSNNIYLMTTNNWQQYQMGDKIELSVIDVELNSDKIN